MTGTVVGEKEVAREKSIYDSIMDPDAPKTRIEKVYGYTPPVDKVSEEVIDVYAQKVEDLDLAAVIKAINGL